jgi:hypothetical protein
VIVTRAGDGSERGDEAQQTARSTSLSAPAPPSPSGGEEGEEDAGEAEEEEESSTNALAFFLKNAAASRSASPALDSTSDALSPSSSLDSILAALPSAAPPYALDLGGDPAQLLGSALYPPPQSCTDRLAIHSAASYSFVFCFVCLFVGGGDGHQG